MFAGVLFFAERTGGVRDCSKKEVFIKFSKKADVIKGWTADKAKRPQQKMFQIRTTSKGRAALRDSGTEDKIFYIKIQ